MFLMLYTKFNLKHFCFTDIDENYADINVSSFNRSRNTSVYLVKNAISLLYKECKNIVILRLM